MSRFTRPLMVVLLTSLLPLPARAGGGTAPAVHLLVTPSCVSVGQRVYLRISLIGARAGEQVAFSGNPTKPGFGGGDLGIHTANALGTVSFTHAAPTRFDWEAGVWVISAYRHIGPPPYTRRGSVWLAASARFTVQPRNRSCSAVRAGGAAVLTPDQVVARYFADLNARRYYAAWLLEASCDMSFSVSNGPGAPVGSEGWQGRGAWQPISPQAAAHPILASAHVTGIRRLHAPVLNRHHILAFGVSGWYTFDYSRVPWANMKHRNGFHVVKIAAWQCNGGWGVEPGAWLVGSGGELTWT